LYFDNGDGDDDDKEEDGREGSKDFSRNETFK
jgi:hypothetical protein